MLCRRNTRTKILEQLIMDCGRFGFTEAESLNYIEGRTGGKGIERSQYYAIKKRIIKNELNDCQSRLVYHTKAGFVINHFKRIDECEHLQSILFKSLYNEVSKPVEEQSAFAISKIASNIMMNSQFLHNLNVSSPIVDQMREYIHSMVNTRIGRVDTNDGDLNDPDLATAMTIPEGFFKTATVSSRDNSGHPVFEKLRKITTIDHKAD